MKKEMKKIDFAPQLISGRPRINEIMLATILEPGGMGVR